MSKACLIFLTRVHAAALPTFLGKVRTMTGLATSHGRHAARLLEMPFDSAAIEGSGERAARRAVECKRVSNQKMRAALLPVKPRNLN